jgi:hypothetical protein
MDDTQAGSDLRRGGVLWHIHRRHHRTPRLGGAFSPTGQGPAARYAGVRPTGRFSCRNKGRKQWMRLAWRRPSRDRQSIDAALATEQAALPK